MLKMDSQEGTEVVLFSRIVYHMCRLAGFSDKGAGCFVYNYNRVPFA